MIVMSALRCFATVVCHGGYVIISKTGKCVADVISAFGAASPRRPGTFLEEAELDPRTVSAQKSRSMLPDGFSERLSCYGWNKGTARQPNRAAPRVES